MVVAIQNCKIDRKPFQSWEIQVKSDLQEFCLEFSLKYRFSCEFWHIVSSGWISNVTLSHLMLFAIYSWLGVTFEIQAKEAKCQTRGKNSVFDFKFFGENCDSQKFHNSDPSLRFTVAEFPIIWQSELKRETISPDWFPSKYEISFDIIFWNVLSRSDRITILPDVFVRYCLFKGSMDGFNDGSAKNHSNNVTETRAYEIFWSSITVNCRIYQVVN